ncbi:hypothetical protein [Gaetbulibacter saemankumensis]|uniref:hypothetical protein n=1 Tax=Gaetbulibacter saemankumensis TaxID=311208 RepID=UPI00040E796A|nr:hypothetical protein [Gaetbulibacter saemankumensis]
MYWDNLKIVRNMVNQDMVSSDGLHAEEYEIISADAKHCVGHDRVNGTLAITNKRIVFSAKSREDIVLGLDEIELVKSNKHIFAVKDKLTIAGKRGENVFRLNYSEDWLSLIEQLLKDNAQKAE